MGRPANSAGPEKAELATGVEVVTDSPTGEPGDLGGGKIAVNALGALGEVAVGAWPKAHGPAPAGAGFLRGAHRGPAGPDGLRLPRERGSSRKRVSPKARAPSR